jgi:hypothetical protein
VRFFLPIAGHPSQGLAARHGALSASSLEILYVMYYFIDEKNKRTLR